MGRTGGIAAGASYGWEAAGESETHRTAGGEAAGAGNVQSRVVSQRFTTLQAAEPREGDPKLLT